MLGDIVADLNVELNEAVHGDGDGGGFDDHDPDVGEGRVEGFEAVAVEGLGDDGDDGHEDADKAVLEDCDPYYLDVVSVGIMEGGIQHTLNHVKPERGMRHRLGQHFCIQGIGQIQFLGSIVLKYSFCACRSCAM